MIPKNRISTHPGEILLREFLEPMKLSQSDLAAHLEIPLQRINEIINGKRGVTPDTAWLLAQAFDMSPEFWLNMQAMHDLTKARPERKVRPLRKTA